MVGSIALVLASLCPCNLHVDFIAMFESHEYRYTGSGYVDQPFRYRLFVPDAARAGTPCPIIVWLHGLGEAGRDNVSELTWLEYLVFKPPLDRGRYPFFLLAVQCPLDNAGWTRKLDGPGDDMINVALAILDETLRGYPVDRDRIYLSGVSSGGTGCWELAARQPDRFAAVAPLATGGIDLSASQVSSLKSLPIWAFHSSRDGSAPIKLVRRMVTEVQVAGGRVALTEIDSESHDCWSAAFNDYCLLDWLLSQHRNSISWSTPPGRIPIRGRVRVFFRDWQWWQLLLQVIVCAVLVTIVWILIRHWRSAGSWVRVRRKMEMDKRTSAQ